MNVGTICSRNIPTVVANESLAEAARQLCDQAADAMVVIASPAAQPTAIGTITTRDILHGLLLHKSDLWNLRVIDILSRNPLVLNEDEDIGTALLKLSSRGVWYAPVVGSGGTLCGAVSRDSLSAHTSTWLEQRRETCGPAVRP